MYIHTTTKFLYKAFIRRVKDGVTLRFQVKSVTIFAAKYYKMAPYVVFIGITRWPSTRKNRSVSNSIAESIGHRERATKKEEKNNTDR